MADVQMLFLFRKPQIDWMVLRMFSIVMTLWFSSNIDVENPWFHEENDLLFWWIFHIYVGVQEGIYLCPFTGGGI